MSIHDSTTRPKETGGEVLVCFHQLAMQDRQSTEKFLRYLVFMRLVAVMCCTDGTKPIALSAETSSDLKPDVQSATNSFNQESRQNLLLDSSFMATKIATKAAIERSNSGILISSDLDEVLAESSSWDCKKLQFNQLPPGSEKEDLVDLCDKMASGSNYLPPPWFRGLQCREALETEVQLAATECGFVLNSSGARDPSKSKADQRANTTRAVEVNFACQCSRVFLCRRQGVNNGRIFTSVRAKNKNQSCPFRFVVYMCGDRQGERSNRWFLARHPKRKWTPAGCTSSISP
jgi:hypothetical protein